MLFFFSREKKKKTTTFWLHFQASSHQILCPLSQQNHGKNSPRSVSSFFPPRVSLNQSLDMASHSRTTFTTVKKDLHVPRPKQFLVLTYITRSFRHTGSFSPWNMHLTCFPDTVSLLTPRLSLLRLLNHLILIFPLGWTASSLFSQ